MKTSELLANVTMVYLPKGRNISEIGWYSGYLVVRFLGRHDRYIFGPAIPESEYTKIKANPFPDRLFTTNIKGKFQCHKVKSDAA